MKTHTARRLPILLFVALILASTLLVVKPVAAQAPLPTIVIQSDGLVYPQTPAISRNGDVYTFTDNLYATIKIQKSNIVLDGAGYTLSGSYNGTAMDVWVLGEGPNQLPTGTLAQYTIGIDLSGKDVEGITIQNLNIRNFSIGMYIWTKNNTVTGNAVFDNIVGILLSGSNETVTKNYIADNTRGLFFGFNNPGDTIPPDIVINHNDFESNIVQLNGCECKDLNTTEQPHNWDNGEEGNHWSDYNGTDSDGNGIGDTAYVIDALNRDRYPLMQSSVSAPTPTMHSAEPQFPWQLGIFAMTFVVIAVLAVLVLRRIKKKTQTP